jgi:hypothetical protein
VDEAPTIARAENLWIAGRMKPIFRDVQEEVLLEHQKLIRALCAEQTAVDNIVSRCWHQFQITEDESEAKEIVEEHLAGYGDIQSVVLDRVVAGALATLIRTDLDTEYKQQVGRELLAILTTMEHGFSRHERCFLKSWWKDFKRGQGRTEEGFKKGEIRWSSIDLKEESLIKWAYVHLREEPA